MPKRLLSFCMNKLFEDCFPSPLSLNSSLVFYITLLSDSNTLPTFQLPGGMIRDLYDDVIIYICAVDNLSVSHVSYQHSFI